MVFPTPYVAALRVYEPIASFAEHNREIWSNLVIGTDSRNLEQTGSLLRMIRLESFSRVQDGAHLLEVDGKRFVAPWSTTYRCWNALKDFSSSLPSSVSKFFLPAELVEKLNLIADSEARYTPHILSETWMIPPRWFALFSPEERLIGTTTGVPFVLNRTKLDLAKQRALKAHSAVRKAFGPGPVEEELVELINWLNVFDGGSILELDYGGLAIYLNKALIEAGEGGIEADTSIEDVHLSIEGLETRDASLAGRGYERLISRWRRVSEYERAT